MKKTVKALALCLALLLLPVACTGPAEDPDTPGEGEYALYFVTVPEEGKLPRDGAVLGKEYRTLPQGRDQVEGLLELLLAGPTGPALTSPLPAGLTLRSWSLSGEGVLTLDLSEAYGGLNGMDLTLADGCLTLTLCQLPQVEAVYLTVEGRARPFRDRVLTPADFSLENTLEGEEPSPTESGEESLPETALPAESLPVEP